MGGKAAGMGAGAVNAAAVSAGATAHQQGLYRFLRELIAIPSTSCRESGVVHRIAQELEQLGYRDVQIDGMGNVRGAMGHGPRVAVFDGHIDTVGVGLLENWTFDPFIGMEDDLYIYGRGTADQTGGFCAAVYGVKLMSELGLLGDFTVWVTGTVQEEDCDGLCWQYLLDSNTFNPRPEFVVITEPTGLKVYRGQRGRMEVSVSVKGVSAHGSAPERGDNAIYKMGPILSELRALNEQLRDDAFLGKGSLTVSEIFFTSPSRCAVADSCSISIDRRLTMGETQESALAEIRGLPSVQAAGAQVSLYRYQATSHRGMLFDVPCYFPTWVLPENHALCRALQRAHQWTATGAADGSALPPIDRWTFSTNGVAIMGMHQIPCIGYGPGLESEAHAPNEKIPKADLIQAVKTYACLIVALEKEEGHVRNLEGKALYRAEGVDQG